MTSTKRSTVLGVCVGVGLMVFLAIFSCGSGKSIRDTPKGLSFPFDIDNIPFGADFEAVKRMYGIKDFKEVTSRYTPRGEKEFATTKFGRKVTFRFSRKKLLDKVYISYACGDQNQLRKNIARLCSDRLVHIYAIDGAGEDYLNTTWDYNNKLSITMSNPCGDWGYYKKFSANTSNTCGCTHYEDHKVPFVGAEENVFVVISPSMNTTGYINDGFSFEFGKFTWDISIETIQEAYGKRFREIFDGDNTPTDVRVFELGIGPYVISDDDGEEYYQGNAMYYFYQGKLYELNWFLIPIGLGEACFNPDVYIDPNGQDLRVIKDEKAIIYADRKVQEWEIEEDYEEDDPESIPEDMLDSNQHDEETIIHTDPNGQERVIEEDYPKTVPKTNQHK